ncbi:coronin-7-like [Ptychodera flava]|uniref:coronin-7-like n=1 Tax=Ptychodera flava TaxID=63121 RepID=UPI00396A2AEB
MSYRFKTSKYKNAVAKIPKKEEWISDISVGSLQSCGNHIKASCALVAFSVEHAGGGSLAVFPVNDSGRKSKDIPLLHAHSQPVTDLDFSPFDDHLLATASQDCSIRIWSLPKGGLTESISTPELTLPTQGHRIENVLFHTTADNVLATSVFKTVKIWDIVQQEEKLVLEGSTDQIQGISWKQDGTLLATTSKDKMFRIFDPRLQTVVSEASSHDNVKDSRVCWLGDRNMVLTTGFGRMRERQYYLWDTRNIGQRLSSESVDSSTGTLMPFFDDDTNMLFLAGKGDCTIRFLELTENSPYLTQASVYMGDNQQKGVAMVPKRALNLMSGEVNRLLQLTQHAVIPVMYQVPRKTYRDFHADLYPDTLSGEAALSADQWFAGTDAQVSKVSLNPGNQSLSVGKKKTSLLSQNTGKSAEGSVASNDKPTVTAKPPIGEKPILPSKPMSLNDKSNDNIVREATSLDIDKEVKNDDEVVKSEISLQTSEATIETSQNATVQEAEFPRPAEASSESKPGTEKPKEKLASSNKFSAGYTSKFRHIQGNIMHKNTHIYNIKNLSKSTFGECDGFHANKDFAAIPLSGPGGLIATLKLQQAGRLPDSGLPVIQNGTTVMDFAWDPFNNRRLAVACDDATIKIWEIPEEGLMETLTEPEILLTGHTEKIYFIKFHPIAEGLLLSASYDMTVRIWDLEVDEDRITLHGHKDQIFSAAWSPDGVYCATISKDALIRIYEPRKKVLPIKEGPGLTGSRGARLAYACNGQYLIALGFDRQSSRQISIHNTADLSSPVTMVTLDTSPAILIPFYDEDTSVLFCTGKGDRIVHAYEVTTQSPYLLELSSFRCESGHQAISFLPKITCDVKQVEIAKAIRLTQTTMEPITFTVPRVKMEYFQDDLYPETKVTWQPVMTACEWTSGENRQLNLQSLHPDGMKPLSSAPKVVVAKKYESYRELEEIKSDDQKKQELLDAMNVKLTARDEPLPQDLMEGADDDEWSD